MKTIFRFVLLWIVAALALVGAFGTVVMSIAGFVLSLIAAGVWFVVRWITKA